MNTDELKAFRKSLKLTQEEMGDAIGIAMRTYQDLENGKSSIKPLHVKALERAALSLAVERGEPMLAPAPVRKDALELARLITGE